MANLARVALLASWFFSAAATASAGNIQIALISDSTLEGESGSSELDGDGMSISARISPFENGVTFYADYFDREYEEILDTKQTRLGIGWSGDAERLAYWLNANFEQIKYDIGDADGFGLHGGLSFVLLERLKIYGELGGYSVEGDGADITAEEYAIGLAFQANSELSLFVDMRSQSLDFEYGDGSPDEELSIDDIRIGIGIDF